MSSGTLPLMIQSKRFAAYLKRIPSDIKKLLREPFLLAGILLVDVFLFLFIVLPLLKIFQLSFEVEGHFSLRIFYELLSKSYNVRPLIHSLTLGTAVAILGTLIVSSLPMRSPGSISLEEVLQRDGDISDHRSTFHDVPVSHSVIRKQGFVSKMILGM
jgi:ABC-type uncharacterized transport system permease subunit